MCLLYTTRRMKIPPNRDVDQILHLEYLGVYLIRINPRRHDAEDPHGNQPDPPLRKAKS